MKRRIFAVLEILVIGLLTVIGTAPSYGGEDVPRAREVVAVVNGEEIYLDERIQPFVCIHCGRCIPFCPHDCLEGVEAKEKSTGDVKIVEESL